MTPLNSKILLIHGDSKIHQLTAADLGVPDAQFLAVASGQEAIKLLQTDVIALVVMDLDIGELDCWRLTRLIRSGIYRCEKHTPIILVAKSWCERLTRITAREFGINHLLCSDDLYQLPELVECSLIGPTTGLVSPRLLVIEDNRDNAELVKRMLRNRFSVELATDGASGLAAWLEGRHDLVLLDVMLPGMSGPEILDHILRVDRNQPVVIMTAHGTMAMAEELMTKGAVDFVSKPFRSEQLRKVCELASCREDYLVSNAQFAARMEALQEKSEAYRKVSQSHQRLLDNLSTVILELDEQGQIKFLSNAWSKLTGYPIMNSLGQKMTAFLAPEKRVQHSSYKKKLASLLSGESRQCSLELPLLTRSEKMIWLDCRLDVLHDESGGMFIFGCMDDITKRKKAQQELEFLAMHDNLTGINNRHYFDNVIFQMSAAAARDGETHALLYIDLDHFKVINDTFGHNHGDIVLRDIASLLRRRVRKSDVLCRIGGDEFAVLIYNCNREQAANAAEVIRDLVRGYQYSHAGQQLGTSCSIGISEIDGKTENVSVYLKQADKALYVAKQRGRNMFHFYDPSDRESAELRASIDWAQRFRNAIADNNLSLMFQPVMHIDSGSIAYYEALVRLTLPEMGEVAPGVFIPALEAAGEISLLDHWVIGEAIELLSRYPTLQQIAINLSAHAFRDERLVAMVERALAEQNVAPQRVIFELTESASMTNVAATQRMIEQLRDIGCSFSLDDFGTGFSTFSYLRQFPAHSIKVDGSFITQLDSSKEDQAVVRAISEVARALGKQTVAEYVETEAVFQQLKKLGIDYAQGYYISRPLHVEKIVQNNSYDCCVRF